MNSILIKSRAAVPQGHLRDIYSKWIEAYLVCVGILAKIAGLKRKREEIKAAPRALADVKKTFLKSLKKLVEEDQISSLKSYIVNYARHPDPASQLRFELPDSLLRVFSLWPDELIDKAFSELEEEVVATALTDAERKKQLNAVDREIKKLETEFKKYPDFPIWREFVREWEMLNARLRDPADPQGIELRSSERPEEKAAFKKLNVAAFNNPKSQFLPAAAN
jgi:hypothetical protein